MKRKELLRERLLLSQEIDDLIKFRGKEKNKMELNEKIIQKKKQYNFYNNLLKVMK